jgi:hypothetical protein
MQGARLSSNEAYLPYVEAARAIAATQQLVSFCDAIKIALLITRTGLDCQISKAHRPVSIHPICRLTRAKKLSISGQILKITLLITAA